LPGWKIGNGPGNSKERDTELTTGLPAITGIGSQMNQGFSGRRPGLEISGEIFERIEKE
jgi:hypothetical protein